MKYYIYDDISYIFGIDDMAGAALISTGVNAIGSLFGATQNNKAQKDLLEAQNSFSEKMWNANNEYNKPINEYQRYVDAGLNPAYFMGNGAGLSSPISSSSAPTPAGNYQAPFANLADSIVNGLGLNLKQKELDLANSRLTQDILESDARISKLASEKAGIDIDNAWKDILNQKTISKIDEEFRKLASEVAVNQSHVKFQRDQRAYLRAQRKTEDALRDPRVKNMLADTFYKNTQIHLNEQQLKNLIQMEKLLVFDTQEREANLDVDGTRLKIMKRQNDLLDIDFEVHNSDEWKAAAKRMGLSDDELTEKYVNGITSTLMNAAMIFFFSKFVKGRGAAPGANPITMAPYNTPVNSTNGVPMN